MERLVSGRVRMSNRRKTEDSPSKETDGRKVLVRFTLGSIGLLTVAIALVVTGACSGPDSDVDQDRVTPASSSTSLYHFCVMPPYLRWVV